MISFVSNAKTDKTCPLPLEVGEVFALGGMVSGRAHKGALGSW